MTCATLADVADMKSLIRRQVRKHSPELANLDNKRRRYSGQARRYKGKVNRYGKDIRLPKGFKPPRGMKLLNPTTAGTAPADSDDSAPDNATSGDDAATTEPNNTRRLIIIAIAVLATLVILTVIGLVLVPRAVDWWQDRDAADTTTVTVETTTTLVDTTVPTTTVIPTPVVAITEWGLGSCVTSSDDIATPSTCDDADLVVTTQVDHPADPLTSDEITDIQTRLADLGVDIAIDGIIGRQTRTAMTTAALTAGLDADVNDRAVLAVIRSIGLDGAFAPDGPRPIQTTPDVCGDGSSWIATPTDVLCLGSR